MIAKAQADSACAFFHYLASVLRQAQRPVDGMVTEPVEVPFHVMLK